MGLQPQNDHEYLVAVWADVQELKRILPDLEKRIARLETFQAVVLALSAVAWPLALVGANTLLRLWGQ